MYLQMRVRTGTLLSTAAQVSLPKPIMLNIRRLATDLSSFGLQASSPAPHTGTTRGLTSSSDHVQCRAASSNPVTEELQAAAQLEDAVASAAPERQQQQEWLVLNFYHLVDLPDPAEVG